VKRRQALNRAREILSAHNIEDAALEDEILLRHVLGIGRASLFATFNEEITSSQTAELDKLVARRCSGEPSAYITGHKEFYGLDFIVNSRVLIPRPETEMLVEKALEILHSHSISSLADIGTGSGCIVISLAVNLSGVSFYAVDISSGALEVARQNAAHHQVENKIQFLMGNLLTPLLQPVDMIIANLPYVKKHDLPVNGFEPVNALDGGADGLDIIRELVKQIPDKLKPGGYLLLEIGLGQAQAVKTLLQTVFPSSFIELFPDLAGIPRVVSICLTPR
jgi:release factor glutamine methyltransferase